MDIRCRCHSIKYQEKISALSIIKKSNIYVIHLPGSPYEKKLSEVLSTKDIVSSKTDQPRLVNNIFLHFFLENEGNAW